MGLNQKLTPGVIYQWGPSPDFRWASQRCGDEKKKKIMNCLPNMVKCMTIGRLWDENISCHINKQRILQPSAISGLQMWMRVPQTVIQKILLSFSPHWWLRSWKNVRLKGEQRNKIGLRYLRCIWKECIQWDQRCASSHTLNAKFLNLISDLWCSDCLLSLLQTCI